jgi:D-lactate dehydrogenase
MASPSPTLINELRGCIPSGRLFNDPLHTLAYGTDASFYRLIPQAVVKVESVEEVRGVLAVARRLKTSVTFRAAGTSLSGQAVTDRILVMLGTGWRGHRIEQQGAVIWLQPGVVGAHANAYLMPYGRKIGPDPASINAAMIGGIAANNASGMCCGTAQNSYRTLAGMRVVLADGTLLDSTDPLSVQRFRTDKRDMLAAIAQLADRVSRDTPLANRIRRKFAVKNTTGYSLNALVDFQDPVEILQHLMIGSEGTLGFIAEIGLHTVPEHAFKASALLMFPEITSACSAVTALQGSPVDAVELMDRASLRSVELQEGMPAYLRSLPADAASLLIETRAPEAASLAENIRAITATLSTFPLTLPCRFTEIPGEYAQLWDIRKGLFPSVGAMRNTGTTCIIEDVAFPVPRLADATLDLRALFGRHGYHDAIIFGHARDGNLHFVFNQDFNRPDEIERYARFMDELTRMVVTVYDGSLKAEHGTGRNIAPFVELEWGAEAYGLMKEIKGIIDPEGVLNPGVILNDDRTVHLKNLKPLPEADPIIDKCIECGFCEVHCPSKDLTLTPRQRIVIVRELARRGSGMADDRETRALRAGFSYDGNETCATDGLCSVACPVGIDTGKLIKRIRVREHGAGSSWSARLAAGHMALVSSAIRLVLNSVMTLRRVMGDTLFSVCARAVRGVTFESIPAWNPAVPRGAPRHRWATATGSGNRAAVYFPSCITRTFGADLRTPGSRSVPETVMSLLRKAGYRVVLPGNLENLCCGMAFDSKGFPLEGQHKGEELREALRVASEGGKLPILMDMSPCLMRMKEIAGSSLHLFDPAEFTLKYLDGHLEFHKSAGDVALHVTCSAIKMGLGPSLKAVAERCAERVIIPDGVECCGWAGDRGFTVPELNASALLALRRGLPAGCREGFSTSRTCEIGLSLHSGIPYSSILELVDRSTSAKERP